MCTWRDSNSQRSYDTPPVKSRLLYQLSHKYILNVRLERFELSTPVLKARYSGQLSYRRMIILYHICNFLQMDLSFSFICLYHFHYLFCYCF